MDIDKLRNWTPIDIYLRDGKPFIDWCFLGDDRFIEPFHGSTIEIRMHQPFSLLFRHQTSIDCLDEIYKNSSGIVPTGFIFHISRCGSTLVSQMLAALEKNIVTSEASVIDKTIRFNTLFSDVSEDQQIIWLRWLFNAIAQKRFPAEEKFFVKFDSWSLLNLSLIEKAFPDVPWIFMYRNPVEVIVSNLRQPGMQMIPGAIAEIFPRMSLAEILQFSAEERFARTIAAFYEAALANAKSQNGKFINYNQLPDAAMAEICQHFRISLTKEEKEKMKEASKFHAKTPQITFTPDSKEKRSEANEAVNYFAEKFVNPLYKRIEQFRLQKLI